MRWDKNYRIPRVINDPQTVPAYGVTDVERAYWNSKQDALEYDAEPTAFSDKMLISGAIYNALQKYKTDTVRICQAYYNTETEQLAHAAEECYEALPIIERAVQQAIQAQEAAGISAENAATAEENAEISSAAAAASAADAAQYARLLSLAHFEEVSNEIYIVWEE